MIPASTSGKNHGSECDATRIVGVRRHDIHHPCLRAGEVLAQQPGHRRACGRGDEQGLTVRRGHQRAIHLTVFDRLRGGGHIGVAVHVERTVPLREHRLNRLGRLGRPGHAQRQVAGLQIRR